MADARQRSALTKRIAAGNPSFDDEDELYSTSDEDWTVTDKQDFERHDEPARETEVVGAEEHVEVGVEAVLEVFEKLEAVDEPKKADKNDVKKDKKKKSLLNGPCSHCFGKDEFAVSVVHWQKQIQSLTKDRQELREERLRLWTENSQLHNKVDALRAKIESIKLAVNGEPKPTMFSRAW